MADYDGAKHSAHEDAEKIMASADKKADEALAGSTWEESKKDSSDAAASTGEQTKEKSGSAMESAKEGTANAAEKTKETTGSAWESTKQGTSHAAQATKEKTTEAKDEGGNLLQKAGEKVQGAAKSTYDALDKANRYE